MWFFFSADWLHDYRLHGMGSIHFCDSQSVPGRNFGKIHMTIWHLNDDETFLHLFCFSDIYLRRHRTGFHPLLFGLDRMGWWGLGKSLPSQTIFVLRCGIHDCGNRRNYFTQHCEIRGTYSNGLSLNSLRPQPLWDIRSFQCLIKNDQFLCLFVAQFLTFLNFF